VLADLPRPAFPVAPYRPEPKWSFEDQQKQRIPVAIVALRLRRSEARTAFLADGKIVRAFELVHRGISFYSG
jgi:hypothetical protein